MAGEVSSIEHLGDLFVDERLSLGVFVDVGFQQDAGSVQLTNSRAGAAPEEMSLRKEMSLRRYSRSCSVSSTKYFFLIAELSSERDQPQDKPPDKNAKSSLTKD